MILFDMYPSNLPVSFLFCASEPVRVVYILHYKEPRSQLHETVFSETSYRS
jgi:hypothetical protein